MVAILDAKLVPNDNLFGRDRDNSFNNMEKEETSQIQLSKLFKPHSNL
jgi:hypothetical protein